MADETTPKPPINVDYFEDLTGDIGRAAEAGSEQIGDRIRRLREEKGLSIVELSHMTGFDVQLLREIEEGKVCPQLGIMIKLSKALESALQRVISGEGQKLYALTRAHERKVITRSSAQRGGRPAYTYMSLAPEVKGRHMEALIVALVELPDDERSVHDGEEFIYVLDGTVVLSLGEETFELLPGDCIYYLSTVPHVLSARNGRAKILAVIYSM